MPKEMRFCRSCGNRLGEGPAEYTETVRFPNANSANGGGTSPFYPSVNGPLIQQTGWSLPRQRRRLGFRGMTWLWIVLGIFFVTGGGLSALFKGHRPRPAITMGDTRSYVGVDDFNTTDGGVTFKVVEPPGGPADRAGLVGGDIITSFDGHPVKEANEVMDLLGDTPVGKRVEVIYTRDGNFHSTQLVTVSHDEYNRLEREFSNRPEGRGKFGYESFRTTPVANAETQTFGVRLNYVETNGPADLFGIKVGDIITEFDGVPIRTRDELLSRVYRAIPRSSVQVTVLRDGQIIKIPVTMGRN